MPRLSDRAFKIIQVEIDSLRNQGDIDKLDSAILFSRLRTLQAGSGEHLTKAQIWEELSDIIPGIDLRVLTSATYAERNSSGLSVSIGLGAAAMLIASTAGLEATPLAGKAALSALTAGRKDALGLSENADIQNDQSHNLGVAKPLVTIESIKARFTQERVRTANSVAETDALEIDAFEVAKSFGWQAALKGQNPPHTAAHWQETAGLWRQAIAQLNQLPDSHPSYALVPPKLAFYRDNLREIEGRQASAAAREQAVRVTKPAPTRDESVPKFSEAAEPAAVSEAFGSESMVSEVDYLAIARRQAQQAAIASQNAPHPAQDWASISRVWKTALFNLDQISPENPQYVDAQRMKAEYRKNLKTVRQNYRQEQSAGQSVASLETALAEVERSGLHRQVKQSRVRAIRQKLQSIPAETEASLQAQKVILEMGIDSNAVVAKASTE